MTIDDIEKLVFNFGTQTTDILKTTPKEFKDELIQQSIMFLEKNKLDVKQISKLEFWNKICLAYNTNFEHFKISENFKKFKDSELKKEFFAFAIENTSIDFVCTLPKLEPQKEVVRFEPISNQDKKNLSINKDPELRAFINRMKNQSGTFNL